MENVRQFPRCLFMYQLGSTHYSKQDVTSERREIIPSQFTEVEQLTAMLWLKNLSNKEDEVSLFSRYLICLGRIVLRSGILLLLWGEYIKEQKKKKKNSSKVIGWQNPV